LSLLGTNVFAKEVVAEPVVETSKEVIVEPVVVIEEVAAPAWSFSGRAYLETEDFDNDSSLRWQAPGSPMGDDEDGTFIGTGISATKGKLTLDLNAEKRFGGDAKFGSGEAEYEATRVDWKVRYQLFEKQAFHIKYRNETRAKDYTHSGYQNNWTRDRYELGTDFNHFNGLLAGWLVAGIDRDKQDGIIPEVNSNRNDGWYWEGDFGPSFKLTDKLSFNPTLFTTGEMYDSYEMVETQIRIMMPYQATDKLTIMPRIRFTLDKTWDTKDPKSGSYVRDWEYAAGDRIRYELMANYVINDQFSTFVGVAYEDSVRDFSNEDVFGSTSGNGKKDLDMWWTYIGLNYKFN
ncbi:MAG: hypothetical protein ACRC92_20945, partial [Peptostreptococcaceae bacterium]